MIKQTYRNILWAEKKVDVYCGQHCDEHKSVWNGYAEGDMQDGDMPEEFAIAFEMFPNGTRVTVAVPICPCCEYPRESDEETCLSGSCDFNWKNWDEEQYS